MKESLIKKFELRMAEFDKRLARLECPHEKVEFREMTSPFSFDTDYRYKICLACGKVLEVYASRESWLAAKADNVEEGLINLRQELDREHAATDGRKKAKA